MWLNLSFDGRCLSLLIKVNREDSVPRGEGLTQPAEVAPFPCVLDKAAKVFSWVNDMELLVKIPSAPTSMWMRTRQLTFPYIPLLSRYHSASY